MTKDNRIPRGLPCPPELAERLRDLLDRHGGAPGPVAELLELPRNTVVSLAAGCRALEGTLAVAGRRLAAFDRQPSRHALRLIDGGRDPEPPHAA